MSFWSSRRFWERAEYWAGLSAALSGAIVALGLRAVGLLWGAVWAAAIVIAKQRLKKIDALEKRRREGLTARIVSRILDNLFEWYFSKVPERERHQHRVTLFVCRDADPRAGLKKRLCVYRRSGRFPKSETSWEVDDNREEGCDGVAGQIWFLNSESTPDLLPRWPADSDDREGQDRYARGGFTTREKAARLNIKSVVFTGAPVRVNGQRWGVLLLDSLVEGYILKKKEHFVKVYARLLNKVLEEGLQNE